MATAQLDPNDPRGEMIPVVMGSMVSISTQLPVLQIGDETFRFKTFQTDLNRKFYIRSFPYFSELGA